MKKNKKIFFILVLVLFISIGYAFLTSNLSLEGLAIIKKSKWDVHFENLVDDNIGSSLNIPAIISDDKLSVNFEVTLNNPGDEYYFYVDVVNNSTFDVMLKDYLVTGLTTEQEGYISTSITYSDEIEINKTNNKYDLLEENTKDTFKILVKYRDDIELTDIPEEEIDFSLTFNTTYEQADENAKERVHNTDVTGPSIKFINKNEVKGNNNWYKSLSVTTKLLDSSPIKSVKYCVTTDDNCTPNTPAEIENNSFTYQLLNDASIQTICIEATDNLDNVCTNCSKEEYKVDGEDPTITSVSVTPDDDTMTIEIVGEDDSSGIYAYYYSKDSGATYVKSKNSNYTFTNLEEGDYLITVYVEDAAGNTSLTSTGTTTIRHKDWCNHNGITNLAECAIATEAKNTNIEEAKISIQNKSNPDFSKSSPSYVFSEKLSSGITTVSMDNKHIYYGDAYTIAEDSGTFSLLNRKNLILSEINLTENMDYYTCSSVESSNNCEKLFKIKKIEYNEQNNNYVIYKNDIIPEIRHYDTTESGMYAKEDDLGKSYYYRGIVGGNFVKFAGLYWRIIRVNGDGSVRLMYFSDKDTTQGKSAMVTKLNNSYWDPTYIGLMYNDRDFSESEITSQVGTYANIGENIIYSYGKSYSYDTNTKKYTLTGDIINGTWKDTYQQLLPKSVGSETEYYYTCFGTGASATSVCPVLMKITGYSNIKTAKVQYLSYTSTSYESATENISKSSLLTKLENWYTTNFANKRNDNGVLYTDYIKDSIFCNDRSLSPLTTGDGFNLAPATQYGAYYRVSSTKNPSLICPNLERDGFTLKASSVGNKTLDYPIGIVTIDEVALAGGIKGKINPLFYMNYQDNHLSLTLSPSVFAETFRTARVWGLYSTGSLNEYTNVGNGYDVRPVISVDPTKFTFTGTGTAEDPFVIE